MEKKENLKYLLPIRSILFILVFVIGAAITKRNIGDISNWWSIVATVINLVTILILVIVTKKIGSNYWKLINYDKGKRCCYYVFDSFISWYFRYVFSRIYMLWNYTVFCSYDDCTNTDDTCDYKHYCFATNGSICRRWLIFRLWS